jgi:16S rRNA processing protein RimM
MMTKNILGCCRHGSLLVAILLVLQLLISQQAVESFVASFTIPIKSTGRRLSASRSSWRLLKATAGRENRRDDKPLGQKSNSASVNVTTKVNDKKLRTRSMVDTSVLFSEPSNNPSSVDKLKNKKKNKYTQFSKADKIEKDPFDALLEESQQKLQSLQKELNPLQQRKLQQEQAIPKPPPEVVKKLEFPNNKDIDPYDPSTFGYVEIGTIQGPHGVHGWAKVQGCTDFPERLTRAGTLLHIKAPKKRAPRKITLASGKFLGSDQFLVQLQGIFDREAAKQLRGSTLYYAKQQNSVELQDDEVIVSDLVGLEVYQVSTENDAENRRLIGTVLGVVLAEEMCAIPGLLHDQIEVGLIRPDRTPKPGQPQDLVLIPMVPEIVPRIDLSEKLILVDPPAGLLDLTYVREEKVRIKGLLAPAKVG